MGAGHRHAVDHRHLYVPGSTPVHRIPASAKLVGLVVFTVAVALTPRRAVGAFAIDAAVLALVVGFARLRVRLVLGRLAVILPFVAVAAVLPFIGEGGDRVDVWRWSLSVDGCWAAFNILAKAGLGATAGIVLAATTPISEMLDGLGKLRVPPVVVAIVSFMLRYLDLLVDQLQRMRNAMVARCHDPRWLWQVGPIASSAGALFVRSYERGERVHQAMAARGYAGTMPTLNEAPSPTPWQRLAATTPGAVAVAALAAALVMG